MDLSKTNFTVVDRSTLEFPEERKKAYYKTTHPELASLAELVADFPPSRPLINQFSQKAPAPTNLPLSKDEIDKSIVGCVIPSKKSFLFKLLLPFSLLSMAAIISLYTALCGITFFFIYEKGASFIQNIHTDDSYQVISDGLVTVFLILLFIGMVKAVLLKYKKSVSHKITREEEPILFHYLETICQSLNAPMPDRVHLTCDVDVSCHYRSIFSRKIDVRIGLPLVSGFSTKELAGVIAHEISRFDQNNSPFLVESVRSLYIWMGKICCHKDSLDQYIYHLNKKIKKSPFKLPLKLIQLFFKIPRLLLYALMWITHLCCQYVIYRIDFESDYYEMQLAGNKKFAQIAYSMEIMSQTCSNTHSGMEVSKKNKTLYEDLPGHIAAASTLLHEEKQAIIDKLNNKKERIHEIHPAFKKRIARANEFPNPGIFNLEKPATRLFLHLKKHKREISIEEYKAFWGENNVSMDCLKSSEIELREMNELAQDWDKLENFFHGILSFETIPIVNNKYPLSAKNWIQAIRDLKQTHEIIELDSYSVRPYAQECEKAQNFKRLLICAKSLYTHESNSKLTIDIMGKKVTKKNIDRLLEATNNIILKNGSRVEEFFDLSSARICYAIQLLNRKEFRAKVNDGEAYRNDLSNILHYLRIFEHIQLSLISLRNNFIEMKFLIDSNKNNFKLESSLNARKKLLYKTLKSIELKLLEIPYPFESEQNYKNIMEYVGFDIPQEENFTALLYIAEETYEKSTSIYFRILARLIHIVEEVEKKAGLEAPKPLNNDLNLNRTCG